MSNYFDFVLVRLANDRNYLFRAPAFSSIDKGDIVICETTRGESMGTVVSSMTLSESDPEKVDFVMNATGANDEVKKVLKVARFKTLEYEEDNDNG